jgi:hypothetical protein
MKELPAIGAAADNSIFTGEKTTWIQVASIELYE